MNGHVLYAGTLTTRKGRQPYILIRGHGQTRKQMKKPNLSSLISALMKVTGALTENNQGSVIPNEDKCYGEPGGAFMACLSL